MKLFTKTDPLRGKTIFVLRGLEQGFSRGKTIFVLRGLVQGFSRGKTIFILRGLVQGFSRGKTIFVLRGLEQGFSQGQNVQRSCSSTSSCFARSRAAPRVASLDHADNRRATPHVSRR